MIIINMTICLFGNRKSLRDLKKFSSSNNIPKYILGTMKNVKKISDLFSNTPTNLSPCFSL